MGFIESVHAKAIDLTKLAVEMTAASGSGHPTSGASLAHLATVLLYRHMRHDPANPGHRGSDRLVLSEGHAVPILYAAAADLGIVAQYADDWRPTTREDVLKLRQIDSPIDGHPHPILGFPFFDAATGSLGQGLSIAAGIAAAARLDGLDRRIYCLIGDGESREGQVWEAMEFIIDHNLATACPIFNCNLYAQSAKVSPLQTPEVTEAKLKAIGFGVRVINGHDPQQIADALDAHAAAERPLAVIAKTIKGWGSQTMQAGNCHGKAFTKDECAQVLKELDETASKLGAQWTDGDLQIPPITNAEPEAPQTQDLPTFSDAMRQFGKESALAKGKWATRRAYGIALRALGLANPNVVSLDGDVRGSTFAGEFAGDEQLAERFFECRIAEQNMIGAAAGMGAGGKIPFASSFAKFLTRGYDQIEMAINSGTNFKLVGSHAGVSLAADGPSQMGLPDVAWFGAFTHVKRPDGSPAMYLLQPADAFAAYQLTARMAEHDGPCYMRTHRPDTQFLYDDNTRFVLGGHELISEGKDLLILASGYTVHEANRALDALEQAEIEATLVDLYSMPFDTAAIVDLALQNQGRVLTVEDNYSGGFGAAVAEALAADANAFTCKQMYVERIPKSGLSPADLMQHVGLSAEDIVTQATALVEVPT